MSESEVKSRITRSKTTATQPAKRSYIELDSSDDDGNQQPHMSLSLEDLAALIVSSKSELQKDIGGVNGRIDELRSHVDSFKSSMDERISDVVSKYADVNSKVDVVADEINRMKQMNELRIAGIPYIEGENLFEIFSKIALKLGHDTSNPVMVPFLHRIGNNQNQPIRSSIIAQFLAPRAKSSFFQLYLKHLKLNLNDIGMSSN